MIAISCTTLLFTSCEKEEMGVGEGAGGGMQDANSIVKSTPTPTGSVEIPAPDSILKTDE
ncbi:hypothetical protein G7050_07115 [Dysgonomonas sp. HDW5A]|uniref:hypothetical protein n=1 Tax=Dysgonomonas sp. HDW5A TaxID=2714926 RepID=UPI0014087625|nr:hypothetical protein [Dysgonomonas sp. HDW5A]QIK59614.1 hypothetical protein G7050_07115 [Dysgonomonas sp. HDW5A]